MILKKYCNLYLVILILFCLLSCTSLKTDADVIGNWEGNYYDHKVSFVFENDRTCIINFFSKQLNKFETISGYFELDFTKKPIPLSITNIPQLNHSMHTIIEFICEDSIRIAEFSPKWRLRPISFETGKTINLKRISKKNKEQ